MFSIQPSRTNIALVLLLLIVGSVPPHRPIAAASLSTSITENHDWRHEQVGIWDCHGMSTFKDGTERPYHGRLKNDYSRDQSSLVLRFGEYRPLEQLFMEEQQWNYVEDTGTHTRTLVTNDGLTGSLISQGPHGNVMQWEGKVVIAQQTVHSSETTTRISAEEYHWYGELTLGEQRLNYYQLPCTKTSSQARPHNP